MKVLDLSTKTEEFGGDFDAAIKHYIHGKEGGVVLDFEGFPDNYAHIGHGIINAGTPTEPNYKPQPIDGSEHAKLVGVVRSTTSKEFPATGMMTQGTINSNATKYPFNTNSLTVLKGLGIHNQVD